MKVTVNERFNECGGGWWFNLASLRLHIRGTGTDASPQTTARFRLVQEVKMTLNLYASPLRTCAISLNRALVANPVRR